jgi:D-beta-D-heptose 7-phosphate kinase/D-beta-D-heptose 1-phosphate adenosyltransferase
MSTDIQPQIKFNILLIGDSCVDEYYIGTCDRLSPEAPVPVIKVTEYRTSNGMAANVKENLEKLNVNVDFVTNDILVTKTRYIDKRSRQHLLRVDEEPVIPKWNGSTPQALNKYDSVVISDYNKGFLDYNHIEHIIRNFKGPIFIDTKKTDLSKFNGAFVKINELENKQKISTNSNLIVTLGSKGAMYKDKLFPTKSVDVVDVCGCGDTFLSALTYQYLVTQNINDAILFANKAASLTVQREGNYAPSLDEINNA